MAEEGTITIGKSTIYLTIIGILAVLLVASIYTQGFGIIKPATNIGGQNLPVGQQNPAQPPSGNTGSSSGGQTGTAQLRTLEIPQSLDSLPVAGQATNGIAVLEFSDFQCPYCGMSWGKAYSARYAAITGTVQNLKQDYINSGKSTFVYMPVAFLGQESIDAANAALCAREQGKFWEIHDAIFEAQDSEENNGKYAPSKLKEMARNITGINAADFNACVDSNRYASQISTYTGEWQAVSSANTGSAGTPTFYILVSADRASKEKVVSAAASAGFDIGISSDQSMYVIIASPEYAKLKKALDALT